VRALRRLLAERLSDEARLTLGGDPPWPTWSRPVLLDPHQPLGFAPINPPLDRGTGNPHFFANDVSGLSIGRGEHDAGTLDQALGDGVRARPPLERIPVPPAQADPTGRFWHAFKIHWANNQRPQFFLGTLQCWPSQKLHKKVFTGTSLNKRPRRNCCVEYVRAHWGVVFV
jgi:hypothetical protein